MKKTFLEQIHNGLIVSCQAPEGSPLHGKGLMAVMAQAAEAGGAAAIRAEGLADIRSIKAAVSIPVLGLIKLITKDTPVIITPLIEQISQKLLYKKGKVLPLQFLMLQLFQKHTEKLVHQQ